MRRRSAWLALSLTLLACGRDQARLEKAPPAQPESHQAAEIRLALAALCQDESDRRARTDFATLAPSSRALGANPYALVALPGEDGFVGILRGDSRVVLLDRKLDEASGLTTAPSPSALAVAPNGRVFVAGPLLDA